MSLPAELQEHIYRLQHSQKLSELHKVITARRSDQVVCYHCFLESHLPKPCTCEEGDLYYCFPCQAKRRTPRCCCSLQKRREPQAGQYAWCLCFQALAARNYGWQRSVELPRWQLKQAFPGQQIPAWVYSAARMCEHGFMFSCET